MVAETPLTTPVAKADNIVLSSEQKQILQLAIEGKSIFYTGSAGKSHFSDNPFVLEHAGWGARHLSRIPHQRLRSLGCCHRPNDSKDCLGYQDVH